MKYLLRDIKYHFENFINIQRLKIRFSNSIIRKPLQVAFDNLNNIHISNKVFIDVKSVTMR